MTQRSLETLEVMLAELGRQMAEVRVVLSEIQRNQHIIVRLDAEHTQTAKALGRAFDQIKDLQAQHSALDQQVPERLSERLLELEKDQSIHSLTSGWMMRLAFVLILAAGGFLLGIIKAPELAPATSQTSSTAGSDC